LRDSERTTSSLNLERVVVEMNGMAFKGIAPGDLEGTKPGCRLGGIGRLNVSWTISSGERPLESRAMANGGLEGGSVQCAIRRGGRTHHRIRG